MRSIKERCLSIARLSALLLSGFAAAASGQQVPDIVVDVSDIWYNKDESGWGLQLVQTGTFVFATLYIYGPDHTARWATAELRPTNSVVPEFTGTLYLNSGPPFNGPSYDPTTVAQTKSGTMTFALKDPTHGRLDYSIGTYQVTNKLVERTPLTADNYSGTYNLTLIQNDTRCSDPRANGPTQGGSIVVNIAQNETSMTQTWNYGGSPVCTFNGTYSQSGQVGTFTSGTADYSCSHPGGGSGTFTMSQMTNRPVLTAFGYPTAMFTAVIDGTNTSTGCTFKGLAAAVPRI
jgi:hypothetical protein